MPKSSSDASHTEHKKLGESSREKKTPTVPHHHDRKKKSGNVQGKEAAVGRKTSSRGENDSGGARRCVRYDTQTVSYVSGGVPKRVLLKVPVLRLTRLDFFSAELRAMTRSQMPKKSDSKEKRRKATPAGAKPKVSAVSDAKHIPVRVTRNNSPPQCIAALAGSKPGNKSDLTQKSKLRSLKKEEVYDDISDVPLEEYCDADSVQVETEAGATKNKPRESQHTKQRSRGEAKLAQAPHKKHKGDEPLETAAAEGELGQPPHKKQKSTPLDDLEDISDTPLDEYGLSEKPSQSVANTTEQKVAKARDKTTGLKPSDSASKEGSSNGKVPTNKAAKKGPPEAHSSVKTPATNVQPSKAKLNLASTKPASKPSPASASAKDVLEKRPVKRPGTPCKDLGAKKTKSDADAAKEKVESDASTTQRSNSSPLLTKKAPLAKPTSKLSPRTKNTAATCGLKETPATKLKASAKTVAQQKSCPKAVGKVEQDMQGKKPVPCSKSSSDKPTSASGNPKNIPASSSTKTAGEVTKAKPSSEGTHESTTSPVAKKVLSTTSPVTKKVLPGKLEKTQAHSTKDSSGITASKSGCSDVPAKDLPTAKTVKSVTDAKANQVAKKKTVPTSIPKGSTDGPAAPKGTPGVAKSSGQSVPVKAPLSTAKPFNDKVKVKPANEPGKIKTTESVMAKPGNDSAKAKPVNDSEKVKPGTCVSSAVEKAALSSKPAKTPASCAKNTSETPVTAAAKASISSAPEKQSFETSPRTNKRPQPDLETEHLNPAKHPVSIPKKTAVENVNANRSTEKKPDVVAPNKDTAKSDPPVCSAAGIEVKICRSKLPSNQKVPKCPSSSQIHAAAAEILSGASKSKGNEQQGTCDALASEKAEQIRKKKKAQLTQCAEPSVSVPDVEVATAEVTGERSSLQSTATCKGAPAVTEMSTETPASTTECVSGESLSDIVGAISESAPCTTDKLHKDKSDSRKPCKSTVQVAAEAQEQNTTSVPHALDVEADVSGGVESMDAGSEEECLTSVDNGPTIHREDGEKQQDASDTAGKSRDNTSFIAAADAMRRGEPTVASTCHPSGRLDGNASQIGTVHSDGDPQEKDDSDLSSVNTSARLQKGLLQAECSNESSTREHTEPPTNAEVIPRAVSVVSLPEQSRSENAHGDSSDSLPKEAIDTLVVTGHSEAGERLLEGSTPSSSAGDMVADTSHSNSQMPSAVNLSHPQKLDLVKASSQVPASDCSGPDKQGTNTCTLQASHDDYQQIDQEKVALIQKPLCDIKVTRERCSSAPLNVGEGNVSKSEETTIGALLKDLIDVASSNAKDDLCGSTATGGSFQGSEEPRSSPMPSQQDKAAKCSALGPTGELDDSSTSMDICQPAHEVLQWQAEHTRALTKEKKGIPNAGSEPIQKLHSEGANKGDSQAGCERRDQVPAKEPSTASPTKAHSSLPLFQPSDDATLSDSSSGDQHREEALKNGPAEGQRGSVDAAALMLRPDTGNENSVGVGSDIPANKSTSHQEEATIIEQQPVLEARGASSDKATNSVHSGLDNGGSTKKRLPAVTAADVEAASDKVTLRRIDREPALDAKRGVEDSRGHVAAPCTKSCGSSLHSALLDLDMISGLHILDVCGSHAERLVNLKKRIMSHSITKNEAVAEISQSVHTAVVEELFKRERAVRTLDLLARIPFSLDPHEVVKIRKVTQSIVDRSHLLSVTKSNFEGR